MGQDQVAIQIADGECRAFVFTPPGPGAGPWPAVIFYMDAMAIRPTLLAMAERLSGYGYLVLLPDLYYRAGPYEPFDSKVVFASDNPSAALGVFRTSTDNTRAAADTAAFLAYLDSRDDIASSRVAATGYCMGGGMALTAAGTYPDRIAAAASFHGGALATDATDSPHRLAPAIMASIYVAGAEQDKSYPPEMAHRLDRALSDAGVRHRCEIYEGALHGWTMTDLPTYDAMAAERHWRALTTLLDETFR